MMSERAFLRKHSLGDGGSASICSIMCWGIKSGQTNLETTLALTLMNVWYWNINSRDYTIGCVILECVVGLCQHWRSQVVIKRLQPIWNYFANTNAAFLLALLVVLPCEPKDFFHESQKNIVGRRSTCSVQSIQEPAPTAYSRVLLRLVTSVSAVSISISDSASTGP
jgi:hypothetical protein